MRVPATIGWFVNKKKRSSTRLYPHSHPNEAMEDDVEYDVPYFSQVHLNTCGETSLGMLLAYHKLPATFDIGNNPRGIVEGAELNDLLIDYCFALPNIRTGTFPVEITRKTLLGILKERGPIVCTGEFCHFLGGRFSHFILLRGVYGQQVIIHDPWHGENRYKNIDTWFSQHLDGSQPYIYVPHQD